jgi:OFA family oxalate/formate antiporter-like MFS transporter
MTFAALVFLFWGEIYSIFPALVADTFGVRNAASNAGTMYTAKGTASLFVPLSALMAAAMSWHTVFLLAAAMNGLAAILALAVLKPMRRRLMTGASAMTASAPVDSLEPVAVPK